MRSFIHFGFIWGFFVLSTPLQSVLYAVITKSVGSGFRVRDDWSAPAEVRKATLKRESMLLGLTTLFTAGIQMLFSTALRPLLKTSPALARYELLLRALAGMRARDVHAVILGSGPEEPALRALAGELGVAERVHWPGFRPDLGCFDVGRVGAGVAGDDGVLASRGQHLELVRQRAADGPRARLDRTEPKPAAREPLRASVFFGAASPGFRGADLRE